MKLELKWIAFAVYWLLLLGLLGPWMVSAASTEAVVIAFVLLGGSAYASYRIIRRHLTTDKATTK